jgi:hypothetical protein
MEIQGNNQVKQIKKSSISSEKINPHSASLKKEKKSFDLAY